jgi:hypothetical protein
VEESTQKLNFSLGHEPRRFAPKTTSDISVNAPMHGYLYRPAAANVGFFHSSYLLIKARFSAVFHFSALPTVTPGFVGFVSAIGRKGIVDFVCGPITRTMNGNYEPEKERRLPADQTLCG